MTTLLLLLCLQLPAPITATVARVIDGDTFVLTDSTRVRLIGVDTPERGEQGYHEARLFLDSLTCGKSVRLEFDSHGKEDFFRRTLAYIFVDDTVFVNKEIIRNGHSKLYTKYKFDRINNLSP